MSRPAGSAARLSAASTTIAARPRSRPAEAAAKRVAEGRAWLFPAPRGFNGLGGLNSLSLEAFWSRNPSGAGRSVTDIADDRAEAPDVKDGDERTRGQVLADRRDDQHPRALAHITLLGDVPADSEGWAGRKDSGLHIEGFMLTLDELPPTARFAYHTVGQGGVPSEWVRAGQFCGTRGLGKPITGFRLRLDEALSDFFDASYEATFIDGTHAGPVSAPEAIEAPSGAPVEAFRVTFRAATKRH